MVLIQVKKFSLNIINKISYYILGEFAIQTCFLGRYGQEIGSDQYGATIMASASEMSSNGDQPAILRLSNIEVNYSFFFQIYFIYYLIC
jgi:hypothetical protein